MTKSTKPRNTSTPAELVVKKLIGMPLGELTRTAVAFIAADPDTADYFATKIKENIVEEDEG